MTHHWINNMPYSGTSVYRQPSGIAFSDSSTLTHEHSSTPNYSSFGLPFQRNTGFPVYQSASPYQKQLEYSSSPSMSEPSPPSGSSDGRSESGRQKKAWLKEEVICLIASYAKKKDEFKNPRVRNKDIWGDISHEMQKQGHATCDAKPCETKFKNLKRAYTSCIDHNKKTGKDTKKCAYYEELHDIFHGDANITPPAVYSNRKGLVKRKEQQNPESSTGSEVEDGEDTGVEDRDEEEIKKKKPRKKPPSERNELVSLFKEFVDRKEEKEEKKLEKLQEMYNEKMSFFGQFLKVFEKSVQDK